MTIKRFAQLHRICESAAKKIHYPDVIDELHKRLPKEWWEIGESTVVFYLPRAIVDLESKEERRRALESIPGDTKITNLRQFIEDGIWALWKMDQ